jgi:CheY-like chemotaxis protein
MMLPKTLVAEHDPADAFRLQFALRKAGVHAPVHFVGDGQEAIDYLLGKQLSEHVASSTLPGLLVLETDLPHLSGFDVLEWLQEHPHLRPARVVMLSATADAGDMARASALGADVLLVKPVGSEDFSMILKTLCAVSRIAETLTHSVPAAHYAPGDAG